MYSRALGLAFLLFSVTCSLAQVKELTAQSGSIQGIVVNENGAPVDHAFICITVFRKAGGQTSCNELTDPSGQFEVRNLPLGSFYVFATKEEDGYSAYNQAPGQKISLTLAKPSETNLTIKLGIRSGTVTASVKDKFSGKPVQDIRLSWMGIDESITGSGSGYSGEFSLNLPPAKDFVFVVSAPGYKHWFYIDPSSRPSLRLESGEKKTLEIELEPDTKSDR
jgi:hypothetical protein